MAHALSAFLPLTAKAVKIETSATEGEKDEWIGVRCRWLGDVGLAEMAEIASNKCECWTFISVILGKKRMR